MWVGRIGGDGSAGSAGSAGGDEGGDEGGLTALQDRSGTDTRHKSSNYPKRRFKIILF